MSFSHSLFHHPLCSHPFNNWRLVFTFHSNACNYSPFLLIQLNVVGRKQTSRSVVLAEPPVVIGELKVSDGGTLGEAQFCVEC
jgi:hypothetical protein